MSIFPSIDFKNVQWKPTLQLHLIRSVAAGLVWLVIFLFADRTAPWWGMPVILPFIYFLGLPIYLGIAKIAAAFGDMGKAFGGFIILVLAIGILVGDPLVYVLHQKRPDLVPVERFKFVNFATILFVY